MLKYPLSLEACTPEQSRRIQELWFKSSGYIASLTRPLIVQVCQEQDYAKAEETLKHLRLVQKNFEERAIKNPYDTHYRNLDMAFLEEKKMNQRIVRNTNIQK